ncbi:unnamed protein product [Protopolystoma xenopodis]|uniref:Uncharacterized protein n=1 Tax=Protopolystoma xenopodis TaxID=117903 RepID=A0A448WIU5_9PLAT|nr:unnamed protein product [Protopolystoma xenopodis]
MVPRVTYFPLVLEKVLRQFSQYLSGPEANEVGLDPSLYVNTTSSISSGSDKHGLPPNTVISCSSVVSGAGGIGGVPHNVSSETVPGENALDALAQMPSLPVSRSDAMALKQRQLISLAWMENRVWLEYDQLPLKW